MVLLNLAKEHCMNYAILIRGTTFVAALGAP